MRGTPIIALVIDDLTRVTGERASEQSEQSRARSVSQLFHGPAPRSPLHRLAVRLRHSRSNTSTEIRVLAPGGYSIVASEVNLSQRTGCSLPLFALYC